VRRKAVGPCRLRAARFFGTHPNQEGTAEALRRSRPEGRKPQKGDASLIVRGGRLLPSKFTLSQRVGLFPSFLQV